MTMQVIGTLIRVVLATVGGANLMSESEMEQLAGALAVVVTAAWGVYQKISAAKAVSPDESN